MSVVSNMLIRLPSDLLCAVGYNRHITWATAFWQPPQNNFRRQLSRQQCRSKRADKVTGL